MNHALPSEVDNALIECREMIRNGSKSFSFASKLFEPEKRDSAFFVYGWCRHCDDEIDAAPDSADRARKLERLMAQSRAALSGEAQSEPVYLAFQHVARKHGIPAEYPLELLEGMGMDTRGETYPDFESLKLYCYRVAGTVGLMMSHVMGVRDPKAYVHAEHLGIAMQLTNISRDVMEDASLGRVYLPSEWLAEVGVKPSEVALPEKREQVFRVVARLLEIASSYYGSGSAGLKYLSFRSALAVAVASSVYSEIGRVVLRRGVRAWDRRAVVPKWKKTYVALRGLWAAVKSRFEVVK